MPKKSKKKTTKKKAKTSKKNTKTNKSSKDIIKAILSGGSITSNSKNALNLYGTNRFGELIEGKLVYSLPEALYLTEKNKMAIYSKGKNLGFQKLMDALHESDKRIQTKFIVFKNLRQRGYIVKTALKFGAEFRVYEKGIKPGQGHAKWILYPVKESDMLTWHEFSAKNRVAHSTKKNLLIAIVDEESDVTYYEIQWTKP